MKPETRKALIALSVEAKREVIVLLAQHMSAQEFSLAFFDEDGDPSTEGALIIQECANDVESESDVRDEIMSELVSDADILHAAICEGRKQDAIDLLNKLIPEANLRPAKVQNHLFPDRVQLDL
jgi:hypothetical protein